MVNATKLTELGFSFLIAVHCTLLTVEGGETFLQHVGRHSFALNLQLSHGHSLCIGLWRQEDCFDDLIVMPLDSLLVASSFVLEATELVLQGRVLVTENLKERSKTPSLRSAMRSMGSVGHRIS